MENQSKFNSFIHCLQNTSRKPGTALWKSWSISMTAMTSIATWVRSKILISTKLQKCPKCLTKVILCQLTLQSHTPLSRPLREAARANHLPQKAWTRTDHLTSTFLQSETWTGREPRNPSPLRKRIHLNPLRRSSRGARFSISPFSRLLLRNRTIEQWKRPLSQMRLLREHRSTGSRTQLWMLLILQVWIKEQSQEGLWQDLQLLKEILLPSHWAQ